MKQERKKEKGEIKVLPILLNVPIITRAIFFFYFFTVIQTRESSLKAFFLIFIDIGQ